jgi:poly-gamma-glutamate capsule biosynthesis protein CapA/YwtB (metallophosphatase superfamily)
LPLTTLLFTGVIVPARCVQAALDEKGDPDYPYEEVRELIQAADLAVGTFNATMSDQVEHTGCNWTYQLVGSPQNADALAWAGFDVMSVATNHIKDCGLMKSWCDYTFFDTLNNLRRVGILPVGGGENLVQALKPVVVTVNGVRFGFVSLGDSKMNEIVFATQDNPGIAYLNEENIKLAVRAARAQADVVIALPHWGSEDIILPNWWQREQARWLVEAGADLVVGNHTHVVQAIAELDGVQVFYGLGNFVFDQGLRDHRQGVILLATFKGTQYVGYKLIPTHVDPDGRVHIADEDESAEILERVEQASQMLR